MEETVPISAMEDVFVQLENTGFFAFR